MRNRYLMNASLAFASLLALNACDSREDYFYVKCDEPEVILVSDKDTSVYGRKYVKVDIGWNETKTVDFGFKDKYGEVSDFSYTPYVIRNYRKDDYYWVTPNELGNHISIGIDKKTNKIEIKELTTSAEEFCKGYYETEAPNSMTIRVGLLFTIHNKVGKEGYANVLLDICVNQCPNPSIKTERIDKNSFAQQISIDGNDPNGDEIVAYEYCIDGTTIGGKGFDFKDDGLDGAQPAGMGAYNGTYITATKLSNIKHIFQSEGEHTISVRCKDKWGMWSKWVKKTITIEAEN